MNEKVAVIFISEERAGEKSLGPPAYARGFGLETHEVKVRSRWDPQAMRELGALLQRLAPRIVHCHEVKASTYVAKAGGSRPPYHRVVTNHGVRGKTGWKIWLYERFFIRVVMRRYERVFTVCTSDREQLTRRGVPASKVHVHLNGVDRPKTLLESRAAESARIRAEWGLPGRGVKPGALCLGIVARLSAEKRHSYMLRAFKQLLDKHPSLDVHLVAFGNGALEASLRSETRALGLENRVHWMGYRKTIGTEIAGFDLLLSLSIAEGLPINLLEAGWAGTPVLATAVDGNHDIIPSPEFGRLVPTSMPEAEIAESLAGLLSDPAALTRSGVRLQQRVEQSFSGTAWLNRLAELYRQLDAASTSRG